MTKFLLHGGATNLPVVGNKKFFKEAVPNINRKIKILIVYFARKKEDYPWMFEQDINNFKNNSPEKDLAFEVADDNAKKLKKQIASSDVIYVRGGNTLPLVEKLRQVKNLKKLLKNKVYAGSSAGMYAVAKYYYSNDRDEIEKGLGIVLIKAFAHWDETKQDIIDKLNVYKEKLPIYKVREGEFITIEQ
ncbi:Type 1 glutamine amidotransferase-like domain-containing protein [Candidatus Falkowbacteria bacterium]|nr:Type 1 glutamine amidotransferase-like domain-containing protein [Candidatus Falkowbacteria bacterium]